MGKSKNGDSIVNRALYSRISYLHQAASYLATRSSSFEGSGGNGSSGRLPVDTSASASAASDNMARRLVSDIRTVGQKVLIRQGPGIKRASCKFCDTVFVEGETCMTTVENASKGGKKPWADLMVVRCQVCKNVRRYPTACVRQRRKPFREPPSPKEADGDGDRDSDNPPGS